MKKITIIIVLVMLPILVGLIVSISLFGWLETSNDWIGFWGGYLGGLCTLVGVLITIKYSKTDSDDKQRLSIIPYISVERNALITIDERLIPIGLAYGMGESRDEKHILFFDELKIVGNCKSVGLGPVINCRIEDIKVCERRIDSGTSKISVLTINSETYFLLHFLYMGLYPEQLKREFLEYYNEFWSASSKQSRIPEIDIEFYFHFEDVIGNKYKQKVSYYGQVSEPREEVPDNLNILFRNIETPELVVLPYKGKRKRR
jgi:hypothetical protein